MHTAGSSEAFWRNVLAGFTAPTPLVVDRSPERGHRARLDASLSFELPGGPPGAEDREAFATGLLALLLARYGSEDVVLVGGPTTVGLVPVRVQLEAGTGPADLFSAVRSSLDQAQGSGSAPADWIAASELTPGTPWTEAAAATGEDAFQGGEGLVLGLLLLSGGKAELRYDQARFDRATIERMAGHLVRLSEGVGDATALVAALPLSTDEEREVLVERWNATEFDFPRGKCLHEIFEERAAAQPEAQAVLFKEGALSYGEVNERANRLAHHLMELGVGPDVPVGISLCRGLDMVVAMMAILKAGGAYLPLDPSYPAERLAFLVEDSEVPVLVTEEEHRARFRGAKARLVSIDGDAATIAQSDAENPSAGATPDHLAYVIYTSGSTGKPKGVMVNHEGRVSNFHDFNERYGVGPGDRLFALASMSFDMCAYDVFGTLMAGATVVVGETTSDLDPSRWASEMVEKKVTLWHSVPALLEILVDHVEDRPELAPRDLRLVLLGGDWIPVSLPDRVKAVGSPAIRVIGMGGATECSMDSTIYEIDSTDPDWTSIPYGAPMRNQRAYVLDPHGNPAPIGVPGELYLGGVGVGRGYRGRPELTAERFLPNPFVDGEHIYRTGDLTRWRDDGNLELLGRIDFQVKIRGYRIELGEIEACMRAHPAVREGVVMAREVAGRDKRLVAYCLRDQDWDGVSAVGESVEERVEQWSAVYDSAYGKGTELSDDPTFNIASWDSSYSGEPYPAEHMREWVAGTVERILSLEPKRVLEIGCGTGLLLFRIAPHVEHYRGVDISDVALDHVARHLEGQGLAEKVSLAKQAADDFTGVEENSLDCVILNSIVMDFPDPAYIETVIRGVARVLRPGGFLFVGDVRDHRTEELFQSSVQLHRAPAAWGAADVARAIDKARGGEEELVIDPAFFSALGRRVPGFEHVEVQLKRGRFHNEMTKFRYNAILVKGEAPAAFDGTVLDWERDGLDLDSLTARAADLPDGGLWVTGIPNARTFADERLREKLRAGGEGVAAQMREELEGIRRDQPGVEPEDVWALAREGALSVDCRFAEDGSIDRFDAVLLSSGGASRRLFPFKPFDTEPDRELSAYFNDPMRSAIEKSLTPELRRFLGERLPDYMVPAAFVYLEAFPLTPNGKINRRALPEPEGLRPDLEEEYVAPSTPLETLLAGIWADGLGLDRIGMKDPFVAVGGNSLLATQLTSRVRDTFGVDLPLKLCLNLDLSALSAKLSELGAEQGIDVGQVAEVYLEVQAMSEDDVQSMLEEATS